MITTNSGLKLLENDVTCKEKNDCRHPFSLILKEEELILIYYKLYYLAML